MIFVVICQHVPERCPASNREVWELMTDTRPKIPEIEKRYGVKNLGTHVLYSSHRQVLILDAPDIGAVESALSDSNVLAWNTVEVACSLTDEEVFSMAFQVPTS